MRFAALLLALALGGASSAAAAPGNPASDDSGRSAQAKSPPPPHRHETKLAGFAGPSLEGKQLSISAFLGKRLLIFCFNPGLEQAGTFARALAKLAPEQTRHNFQIVGVAMGLSPDKAREFARKFSLDFPIFDDSRALIGSRLGLMSPLVLLGVDAEGYVNMAMGSLETEDLRPVAMIEKQLREYLRLPQAAADPGGGLDRLVLAPLFETERMHGDETFRLADLAGEPVLLVFFLHTCPHCQLALRFFKQQLERLPEEKRPVLLGVSLRNQVASVEATLRAEKLDFFPVLLDSDGKIRDAYGVFAGVPDIMFIDRKGHIRHRIEGWSEQRDPALAQMYLADIAEVEIPMLLDSEGYSGNDFCAVCHEEEAATWEFTSHAVAFDSLVTRGVDRDPDCVSCHVVGFEKPGGYWLTLRQTYLENVGCEACHGAGGGHLKSAPAETSYERVCKGCHDSKHSLGFDYESFAARISHTAIAQLSRIQRKELLTGRDQPRDLLPRNANIVGSLACKGCHEQEYARWAKGAHARSVDSLRRKGKEADSACLRCHVTAYGRPGGFPKNARVDKHRELAKVGCESCHGPGGKHVADGAARVGDIVSLGDKCDSCVILQICGNCHDEANDPGFRFNVSKYIEAQRHGS